MINSAPEVMKLSVYLYENLIQMPRPVRIVRALHAPFSDLLREEWTEAVPPKPHCFMRGVDTALVKQILHVPQREREADIHHHRKANDLGRCFEIFERVTHTRRLRNGYLALKAKFL